MILLFYYLGFIITVFIFKNLKTAIIWLFNLNFSQSIHDKRGENLNLVITISLFMLSSSYLINSQSLLSIYLSMELQSFCTLLILFLMSDSLAESPEAIFKYFIISSITGLLYLCGFYFSTFELNGYLDSASVLNKNNLNLLKKIQYLAFINHICFDFYFVHKHIFCLLGSLVQVSQVASSLSPNCLNCQFFWIEIDRTCESFNEKGEVLQTNFRDRVVLKLG